MFPFSYLDLDPMMLIPRLHIVMMTDERTHAHAHTLPV